MTWDTIREALPIVGKKIVEITADDWDDVVAEQPDVETRVSQIYLHLDDGSTVGFFVTEHRGFTYDGYKEGEPAP
jgi:hypothetical protein